MPDTQCPRCRRQGLVRKEQVVKGARTAVNYYCGACNHEWSIAMGDHAGLESTPEAAVTSADLLQSLEQAVARMCSLSEALRYALQRQPQERRYPDLAVLEYVRRLGIIETDVERVQRTMRELGESMGRGQDA